MKRILFVCIHNSARSQMAEAFVNTLAPERFVAESAGIEAGRLNPVVVQAMQEIGIDISGNSTSNVADFLAEGRAYDFIVTVCDKEAAERCPLFPGNGIRLHWGFPDPSSFQGTPEEKLAFTRTVRDSIRTQIEQFLSEQA